MKKGGLPKSEATKIIHALFRMRPTTRWSEKECKSMLQLRTNGCFDTQEDLDDLRIVCLYHNFERKKGDNGKHRRDLLTFLNNYPGERIRAMDWAERYPKLARPIASGDAKPKETPARWDEFLDSVYPTATQCNYRNTPESVQREFREWLKNENK